MPGISGKRGEQYKRREWEEERRKRRKRKRWTIMLTVNKTNTRLMKERMGKMKRKKENTINMWKNLRSMSVPFRSWSMHELRGCVVWVCAFFFLWIFFYYVFKISVTVVSCCVVLLIRCFESTVNIVVVIKSLKTDKNSNKKVRYKD